MATQIKELILEQFFVVNLDFKKPKTLIYIKETKMVNVKFFIFIYIALFCTAFSQEMKNDRNPKGEYVANNCENNKRIFDSILQDTVKKKSLIIISYLGKTESAKFNKRRLHNAKTYINPPYEKNEIRVVTAHGERVSEAGFLDFFIGGILEYRVFLPQNRDLILSSCQYEPEVKPCSYFVDKMFYPCLRLKR